MSIQFFLITCLSPFLCACPLSSKETIFSQCLFQEEVFVSITWIFPVTRCLIRKTSPAAAYAVTQTWWPILILPKDISGCKGLSLPKALY